MVDRYVDGGGYDPVLGWVPGDHFGRDGVDDSVCRYTYEPGGHRRVVNYRDGSSRIHTYGDSFTHCDQVSDGETWQEYLAAHLQEPIHNYGIGGHSVHQAYCRMRIVESQDPAQYIILNIYDDDHYRNLDVWRSIRMGRSPRWMPPYIKVNVDSEECIEYESFGATQDNLYRMCDGEFIWNTFKDDPSLKATIARHAGVECTQEMVDAVAEGFGISADIAAGLAPHVHARKLHTEAALFASRHIVTQVEALAQSCGKSLMLILSFNSGHMRAALMDEAAYDQTFLDWLSDKPYPVIDMRDAFKTEYARSTDDPKVFLGRYYNGHHTPLGNYFTAWTLKDRVVQWLSPAPTPYKDE